MATTRTKKKTDAVPKSSRELKPLELLGVNYMIRPLKGYAGLVLAEDMQNLGEGEDTDTKKLRATIDKLVDSIFTKQDRPKIRGRLMDPDDDLDMLDIVHAMPRIMEDQTGNPTT